jgi:hypothetical protein
MRAMQPHKFETETFEEITRALSGTILHCRLRPDTDNSRKRRCYIRYAFLLSTLTHESRVRP